MRAARWQGLYYLVGGAWPLVHYPSFERATGRKRDRWLVETVAGLLVAIGGAQLARPSRWLGLASACTLAAIDVRYAARGTIARVYYADAAVELAIALALLR